MSANNISGSQSQAEQTPFAELMRTSDPTRQGNLMDMALKAGIPTDDPLWVIVLGLNHLSTFDKEVETQLTAFEQLLQGMIVSTFDGKLDELDKRMKLSNGALLKKIAEGGGGVDPEVVAAKVVAELSPRLKSLKGGSNKFVLAPFMQLGIAGSVGFVIAMATALVGILPLQLNAKIAQIQSQVSKDTAWAITPSGYKAKAIYELNRQNLSNCRSAAKKQMVYLVEGDKKITENLCVVRVP
jgi:hypothetical protein